MESIVDLPETSQNVVCMFDWFDSLLPGQQFFSYDGTGRTMQGLMCPGLGHIAVPPVIWVFADNN